MERDWAAAEAEYQKALYSAPPSVMNKRFYAYFLLGRERSKEAFQLLKEAIEDDREGVATNLAMATTYYWTGHLDEAILRLNEIVSSNPSNAAALEILSDAYESKGRSRLAVDFRAQALRVNGETREAAALERDYSLSGFQNAMHNFYDGNLRTAAAQMYKGIYVSPLYLAILYIHLGDKDRAFQFLDRALKESSPWLGLLRVDPVFESIRSDQRFKKLVDEYEHPSAPPFR